MGESRTPPLRLSFEADPADFFQRSIAPVAVEDFDPAQFTEAAERAEASGDVIFLSCGRPDGQTEAQESGSVIYVDFSHKKQGAEIL
jgi:hypothetical protein